MEQQTLIIVAVLVFIVLCLYLYSKRVQTGGFVRPVVVPHTQPVAKNTKSNGCTIL